MAVVERPRGKKEHGTFSITTTPVILQAASPDMLSFWLQVDTGGGDVRLGNSSLSTTNAPKVKAGGDLVLDQSQDAIWIVGTAAATGTWLREVKD